MCDEKTDGGWCESSVDAVVAVVAALSMLMGA